MANPVIGYDGSATIAAQAITKIRKWTHTSERDTTEQGPWVGDAVKVVTIGGKLGTLELEGDIPIGGDAGVDDIKDAYENGTSPAFVATQEDGYAVTYATPSYTAFSLETDASGTQTWKATLQGAYTLAQDS
jgi:hypothetical protein